LKIDEQFSMGKTEVSIDGNCLNERMIIEELHIAEDDVILVEIINEHMQLFPSDIKKEDKTEEVKVV
jgi:hypothetical protein